MSGKNQRGRVAGEWAAKYGTVEVGLREKEERCVKVRGIIGVGIFKGDVGLTKREIGVQGGLWGETKALRAGAFHLHQPQIITPFMWYFSDMFHSIFICLIINTVSGESSLMLCLHSSSYRHFPSVPSLLFFFILPFLCFSLVVSRSPFSSRSPFEEELRNISPEKSYKSEALWSVCLFFQHKIQIKSNLKFCFWATSQTVPTGCVYAY